MATSESSEKSRDARRVRFLRNNNVRFAGIVLTVSQREHRTFEKLLESVTRALNKCSAVRLPTAVCQLRRVNGEQISKVSQLLRTHRDNAQEPGIQLAVVVACCQYEKFRCLEYNVLKKEPLGSALYLAQSASSRSYTRLHRTVCPSSIYEHMPLAMLIPRTLRYRYTTGHLLPSGHSGAVLVLRHAQTRERLVLKVMELRSEDRCEYNECRILQKLQGHPQIINLMLTEITSRAVYIIVEAMDMDMMDFRHTVNQLTEPQVNFIMRSIIQGLAYVHSMDIVHRDIKLDNILVRLNTSAPMLVAEVKIADFGLARYCLEDEHLFEVVGTERYIAPEVLACSGYNKLVDCFSAGVTFHLLVTNHFPRKTNVIAKTDIHKFSTWSDCCDLLSHMLQPDPTKRWSAYQLSKHLFFQSSLQLC